jgi:FkbM family methyltransferase
MWRAAIFDRKAFVQSGLQTKINQMFYRTAGELLKRTSTRLICADVGSAGGIHPRFVKVRDHIDMIGFDADENECRRLQANARIGDRCVHAAIGRDGEDVVVELHKKRQTSSIYPTDMERVRRYPDPDRYSSEKMVRLKTVSLDSVCKAEKIANFDYLKVDTEGHELAILEGYHGSLMMAEIEINFHPFRKGIPLFDQVMSLMRSRGFILIDLRRAFANPERTRDLNHYAAKGFLIFGDALFLLDPFAHETHRYLSTPELRAKYLALLCLYGYAAEALMVLDILADKKLAPQGEIDQSRKIILSHSRQNWRLEIGGLGRVMFLMEKFVHLPFSVRSGLRVSRVAQSDREVGNY